MSDFPDSTTDEQMTPLFIHTWGLLMGANVHGSVPVSNPGSMSWGTANLAMYIPFWLPFPYVVRRLFWQNGSGTAGNSDIGLYSVGGSSIYTAGSTANSGNGVPQYVTPSSSIVLSPGRYMIGFVHSSTSANHMFGRSTFTAAQGRLGGCYSQTSALPLPATATFAQYNDTHYPLIGITRTASGF